MKYLLISKETGEQAICDKVTIDGFDYYVSDNPNINDVIVYNNTIGKLVFTQDDLGQGYDIEIGEGVSYPILEPLNIVKKAIATNNPNIDVPQVVDEAKVINLAFKHIASTGNSQFDRGVFHGFVAGYHKSQETHPFSEEDMVEFYQWCDTSAEANLFWRRNRIELDMNGKHHEIIKQKRKELLQLWKEQNPKKVYYNLLFNTK